MKIYLLYETDVDYDDNEWEYLELLFLNKEEAEAVCKDRIRNNKHPSVGYYVKEMVTQ